MTDDRRLERNPLVDVAQLEALHEPAFGWAMSLCGYHREEAEDIMQAAYASIISGQAVFRGESQLKTWLFGVIRNLVRRRARKMFVRNRLLNLFRTTHQAEFATEPPEPDMSHDATRVMDALDALTTRQRHVVELVFYRDCSVTEAAKVVFRRSQTC